MKCLYASEWDDPHKREYPARKSASCIKWDDGTISYSGRGFNDGAPNFNTHLAKAEKHNASKIKISIYEDDPLFRPKLERIENKLKFTEFELICSSSKNLLKKFTLETFAGFDHVTDFRTYHIHSNAKTICWPHIFPNLKAVYELNARTFDHREVGKGWPHLEYADFMRLQHNPAEMGPLLKLKFLRLVGGGIPSLEGIADAFPNLETLVIARHRKDLDLSPLSEMKKLKNLRFDGGLPLRTDELVNPSLRQVYFGKLTDTTFLRNNPKLTFLRVKKLLTDPDENAIALGWARHKSPIPGHEGWGVNNEMTLPSSIEG